MRTRRALAAIVLHSATAGGLLLTSACIPGERLLLDREIRSHRYTVTELARGLDRPWGMAFLPDGDLLITERSGAIRRIENGQLAVEPVPGGPRVQTGGQGGLLDIALHPDFEETGWVYLSYSKATGEGSTTAVARARWTGEALDGMEEIFAASPSLGSGRHFGSRLLFDRDGLLWVTVGDMGRGDPAQSLTSHAGSVLRLRDDGSVPADNPFLAMGAASMEGGGGSLPEIFSYGHRNPQGMALHPASGEVWVHEHGPRGGDAIHRLRVGANYGWPLVSFGREYTFLPIPDPEPGQGIESPLHHWTPSIAPSGLTFYQGDRFPHWRGDLFAGALAGRQIRRVVFRGTEPVHEEILLDGYGERIRDVRSGPDGFLYFLTDSADGVLGRLEPADS